MHRATTTEALAAKLNMPVEHLHASLNGLGEGPRHALGPVNVA